jgi:hypothetical protein
MKANAAEKHPGTPPTSLASPSTKEGGAGVHHSFPALPAELAEFLAYLRELDAAGGPYWARVDRPG